MNFMEPMIMTASMHKKNTKKDKRIKKNRRKNKLALFAGVFFGVLIVGSIILALMAAAAVTDGVSGDAGRSSDGAGEGQGTILSKIADAEEEAVQNIKAGLAEEEPPESRYSELLQSPELMKEQKIYAKEAASPDEIVLDFAGDILFDPYYAVMARLKQAGGRIEDAFSQELLEEMRSADIFMVNNEFPYSDRGAPLEGKQFTFRAQPESAAYLTDMGVDVVSLANNHTFDYGEEALLDSLATLEAMDMPYVGAGRNIQEAAKPVSFIINDKKIAIVSATQIERNDNPDTRGAGEDISGTFRCWNPDRLLQEIAAAREDSDIVIVYIHWGTENQAEIDWAQQEQAAMIAEAGADLIIGAHPHCLQPVAYVGGVPVVYSLGNFWFNSKTVDTALLQVRIPKEGELSVRVLPAKQSDCRTLLLDGEEKQRVIAYINSISESAVLDEDGNMSAR